MAALPRAPTRLPAGTPAPLMGRAGLEGGGLLPKMERKADMSIGRFTEFVEALGGRWQITVSSADGREYSAGHRA